MAYVNVADWKSEQVAEWLKGLDSVVLQYIRSFVDKNINGQQLLDLQPDDLEDIGVYKIGHQEIILEAIELLKNFYYDLDRENVQLLSLRLSCLAHSLYSELWRNHINNSVVSTQVLADVANVVSAVKPLVCWLDRSPFSDQTSYVDKKNELLELSLKLAMSGVRDRFVDKPIEYIRESCKQLAELADTLIQSVDDSLLLQPASLDLATLKKRPGDHLDFYIVPSFHGMLQVGELKCNSAAHQSGKIEMGDEIVQINYQTVVGWEVKEVMSLLFEESSTEVLMTLKKRPRHSKVFGQIYIKPYRLPCKKQIGYSTKWNDILSPPRPELLSVPSHFGTPFRLLSSKPVTNVLEIQETKRVSPPSPTPSTASSISSRSSESEFGNPSSPNSVRLYLPKPRIPVQRRATITGASPVSKHAPLSLEQFWHELKLEREWRSNSDEKTGNKSSSEMQLKRSPPIAHCSLNWSIHLNPPANDDDKGESATAATGAAVGVDTKSKFADRPNPMATIANTNGIVQKRIESLSRSILEQSNRNAKKPRPFPKPILANKTSASPTHSAYRPETVPRSPLSVSPRRERGKLDKSYSTPSYDYSVEPKEPPHAFNMKLPEEMVKSAPESITSDVEPRVDFGLKVGCDVKSLVDVKAAAAPASAPPTSTAAAADVENVHNEYLEIKSDDPEPSPSTVVDVSSKVEPPASADPVNNLLDTINASLLQSTDSEPEACTAKDELPPPATTSRPQVNGIVGRVTTVPPVPAPPLGGPHSGEEAFNSRSLDASMVRSDDGSGAAVASAASTSSLGHDAASISSLPQPPSDRFIIHTTINVPATFPRHKIESKKQVPPPEPPPRPQKGSPIHKTMSSASSSSSSSKSGAVSKTTPKHVLPHKSPKATRKKNILLTKRRNVSVRELGVCDHEGWLYHRSRKMSRGTPQWLRGWFIIKGTIFYGFNSPEASRARLMISLPGFTVSPAEEVKSRNYSFKVYHTGTTFYFAAESGEDLALWVESFSRVTISDEELSIVVSETEGEEDDESQPAKKEKSGHETHGPHMAAMKKLTAITGLLSLSAPDSSKSGDKKFNSLKKSSSRKSAKDESNEGNHVASLDRKYLKFLSSAGKQNVVPVPTAQFRSYRRVPPMEKPPQTAQESLQSTDLNRTDSMSGSVPVPSASPTRPPDMADYRLASLAKCNMNNQRTPETSPPGGYMTLESFMLSRQEEERRHQLQHPRATNVLRVPQCHAPPPPTPIISHNVAAATGRDHFSSSFHYNSRSHNNLPSNVASTSGKNWADCGASNSKFSDHPTSSDFRSKFLKKTTQYQPPPWEPPSHNLSDESRLQPAFEMTLDRNFPGETNASSSKSRKSDETSGSSLRFKGFFGGTKTDGQKTNLLSSPRLRRVLFRDKKNSSTSSTPDLLPDIYTYPISNAATNQSVSPTLTPPVPSVATEMRLPNAPDYPGLEYPPVFEPGTYSLSDVSTLLRNRRVQPLEEVFVDDDPMSRQNDNYFAFDGGRGGEGDESVDAAVHRGENNNGVDGFVADGELDENGNNANGDDFHYYNNLRRQG